MGACAAAFALVVLGTGVAGAAAPGPPLAPVWRYSPGASSAVSSPALAPGAVVLETTGEVVGLDPANGHTLWTTARVPGPLARVAVDGSTGGGLIVYTEGGLDGSSASVVAMSIADRSLRWAFTLPKASLGGPVIEGGTVYVGTSDGSVFAIDEEGGSQRWRARTDGPVVAPPAASGGRVFAASVLGTDTPSHLYAWDAETGKLSWDVSQRQGAVGTSAVTAAGGRVYVGMDGLVQAFDASSGDSIWLRSGSPSGGATFSPVSTPVVEGDDLYVLDAGGHLTKLRASDGTRVWDFLFETNSTRSSALVAGDVVYAGLDDGSIGAVSDQTGNQIWRSAPERGPVGTLLPSGDQLLAPHLNQGGGLVALGHTDGALTDIVSPSKLNLGRALLDFVAAAALLALGAAAITAIIGLITRRGTEVAA
jgi:eukaryotic-like serine/threonine-protein kinase